MLGKGTQDGEIFEKACYSPFVQTGGRAKAPAKSLKALKIKESYGIKYSIQVYTCLETFTSICCQRRDPEKEISVLKSDVTLIPDRLRHKEYRRTRRIQALIEYPDHCLDETSGYIDKDAHPVTLAPCVLIFKLIPKQRYITKRVTQH